MKVKMDWNILIDYLDGVGSKEQMQAVEAWLEADPSHREDLERVRCIWQAPGPGLPKSDVEAALARVRERTTKGVLTSPEDTRVYRFEPSRRRAPIGRLIWGTPALRAAASVLVIVGMTAAVYFAVTPKMESVDVARGTRAQVMLPDGSHVTLDAGSRLEYPARFGRTRRVSLDGEGYFRVTPGDERFVVRALEGVVTVLGTSFNVRAWSGSKQVEVAVAEGTVSLRRDKTPEESGVTIGSGRMSRLADGPPTAPVEVDISEHVGWLVRERHYENAPLSEVLDQVERWYDLTFVLPESASAENRVTVHLENRSVEELVDMLALVNGFGFEMEGKRVTFSRIE